MERKKITFDSFIRAVILGAIIIGGINAPEAIERRIASVLPCLAYCLSDISVGKLLPA